MPCVVFGIEPIATFGQLPPEKHAFLTNQTILRTSHLIRNIQIVDRETGEIIDEFGTRPKRSDVVFSPNALHLAILNDSTQPKTTTVNIWDVEAQELVSEWEAAVPIFDNAVFSPTHPLFAAIYKNEIYLWNWQTGELVGTMAGNRRKRESCYVVKELNGNGISKYCSGSETDDDMVFTPDGKHLIVASKRPDIELWNVGTRELVGHFEGHTGNWVDGVAISPDGKRLASFENRSDFVYMWDIATRQLLWREPIDETGIADMVFSANSQHLYAAYHNVYIWDVKSGQQIDSFGNDYSGLRQMILSPNGKTMLLQYDGSFLWGGVVELWNTETKQQLKVFADFIGGVPTLSSDGETMISINSNFIKVWDIPSQQVRFVISAEHFYGFHFDKGVAISSDSKRIAYSRYPWVEIANLQNGNVEAQYQHYVGFLDHAAFSSSGKWLTGVDNWGYLHLFDVSNPGEIHRVRVNFQLGRSDFYQVAFSENDEYMAATARSGERNNYQYWILLWKREGDNFQFQYKWETPEHSSSSYSTLAFASTEDGSTVLAASSKNSETRIWQILPQNAQLVNTLLAADAPIHFSPDNRYLFTDRYRELQIWDWQTSRPIKYPSIPRYSGISQDGSILVSKDEMGRYLIWDAKNLFSSLPYPVESKGKKFVTLGQIKKNRLLQNFPNPFNPETWIPFRLADESDVMIRIYTPTGKLVRSLSPGTMSAGDYSSQSQAIHWDGHNDKGEAVSSGVYLYTIDTGDFSATRKMLIRK
jgi:WD40 repeat protein